MRAGIALAIAGLGVCGSAQAQQATPPWGTNAETFEVGAGVLGFVGRGGDVHLPDSVAWSMRYAWTQAPGIAWEWTYVGATTTARSRKPPTLITLAEADLKLEMVPSAAVHPFVGAGLGFGGFSGAPYRATMTVPAFAGIELDFRDVLLGSRITGRPTFFDGGLPLDTWTWTVDLASKF